MFDEIYKLNNMLVKANIPHTLREFSIPLTAYGYQIILYADAEKTQKLDDVVCHDFSHGFHLGLLETYTLGKCEGYETAEQVFLGWTEIYQNAQKG